jgi:Ca2+-binding RTX toxin-like protein
VVVGGADSDTIGVNGTTVNARGIVLGDSGSMLLSNAGTLLSIDSTDFASGAADSITLTNGTNTVIGGAGGDTISAGAGTNTILGDDGKATFFANGDLRLIESINLGNGGDDSITLSDGVNSVVAGAGSDTVSLGAGRNFVLGDEGRREVLTDSNGAATGTTLISSLNGLVGGTDSITVGSGYNVVAGGANVDTITVNGTTPGARGIVMGDNGKMTLDNSGTLLEIESTDFAGGAGDTINLTAGTNAIIGGAGADQITATTGRNTVLGDDGHATFYANGDLEFIESINLGNGGNDTISLQNGVNAVIGGAGADQITAGDGTNIVLGDEGQAAIFADGTVRLIESTNLGVGGVDTIELQDGTNTVIAGAGSDNLTLGGGRNFVFGDEGRYEVLTSSGTPTGTTVLNSLNPSVGGQENITVGPGFNVVVGGAASDTVTVDGVAADAVGIVLGDNGRVVLSNAGTLLTIESTHFASGSGDTITLASGQNTVIGGAGADQITAGGGTNTILGDDGKAVFFTDGAVNTIESINLGNGANDTITLQNGRNIVIAGAGSDTVSVGAGNATILGDEGQYVVTRATGTTTVTAQVIETLNDAVGGNDTISATGGINLVMGGAGSDTITGTNPISGAAPKFTVLGDSGRAELNGANQLLELFTKSANTGAADTIQLANADDIIMGGDAGDVIDGAEGDNIVLGDHGHASFDATGQLRTITSTDTTSGGDDTISIGSDNDLVFGGFGKETLTATSGDNIIVGDSGRAEFAADGQLLDVYSIQPQDGDQDTITTGTGNDIIIGGTAADTITSFGGNSIIVGDSGHVTFDAAGHVRDVRTTSHTIAGNDVIGTGTGNDIILGGSGSDQITSTGGNNIVLGDNGQFLFDNNGKLVSAITADVVLFGNDTINLGNGNDVVLGGSGRDVINAANGNNIILGDNGKAIFNASGHLIDFDTTDPAEGDIDTITVGTGNDIVIGGAAADHITAAGGANVLIGDNAQIISDANGNLQSITTKDPLIGGNDTIISGTGNDVIFGGSAADTITDAGGRNIVVGDQATATFDTSRQLRTITSIDTTSGGIDTITTGTGDDIVLGGSAADTIAVSNGNNLVLGDHGQAVLDASGRVMSVSTIAPSVGGGDKITSGTGNDIVIGGVSGDTITITGGHNMVLGDNGYANFDANGVLRDIGTSDPTIGSADTIKTGTGNDIILGGLGADKITSTGGNNIVLGDHGQATFNGSAQLLMVTTNSASLGGADTITLGSGHDIVFGGTSGDTIKASSGNNIVVGDSGTAVFNTSRKVTSLTTLDPSIGGNDVITSSSGHDLVIGGVGNDTITSTGGNNIVLGDNGNATFNSSGAILTLNSSDVSNGGLDTITTSSGNDVVFAGSSADTILAGDGKNLVLGDNGKATFDGLGQWLTVDSTDTSVGDNDSITTGMGNDTIFGGTASDTIEGSIGDNVVLGDSGKATFNAAGQILTLTTITAEIGAADVINTGSGNDVILGGAAADLITASDGNNIVVGDSGAATWNASGKLQTLQTIDPSIGGADVITAGTGNDLVFGGIDNDILRVGDGQNTVVGDNAAATFDANGGMLTLTTTSVSNGGADIITSGTGIDVILGGSSSDSINAGDGKNLVLGDNGKATFNGLGQWLTVESLDTAVGDRDTITTGTGNDVIFGGTERDTIQGSTGNNVILGDSGKATFNAAGQILTLTTTSAAIGDIDTITTGSDHDVIMGGAAADVIVSGDGHNVVVGDSGAATWNTAGKMLTLKTIDPSVGGADDITTGVGNDLVFGGVGNDVIRVNEGNNTVVGDNASATFDANGGMLTLTTTDVSNGGLDTITSGTGIDVIFGGSSTDTINAGNGKNLVLGDNGKATFNGLGQWLTVESLDTAVGDRDTITTGTGNDVIFGGTNRDTINGSTGNNVVLGDSGKATFNAAGQILTLTTISAAIGDIDTITTSSGHDVIMGGAAGDIINGSSGNNVVIGDSGAATWNTAGKLQTLRTIDPSVGGNDTITTSTGHDIVFGGVGNDTMKVSNGNNIVVGDNASAKFNSSGGIVSLTTTYSGNGGLDTITSGTGNDVVFGGSSNDSIAVSNGRNIVAGDNAQATFDASGQIRTISTIVPAVGGNDTITSGLHDDLLIGGAANDSITTTGGNNVILGDNGAAEFDASGILQSVAATDPTIGGSDTISSGAGNDLIIAGTAGDDVTAGAGNDLIFGDHGRITGNIRLTQLPLNTFSPDFTFTSIATQNSDLGGNDIIRAGAGEDIVVGGQGFDKILGEAGDDDITGGHTVADGNDIGDWIDGGSGHDYIAGDNAYIHREPRTTDSRWRTLSGTQILEANGNGAVTGTPQTDPAGVNKRAVVLFNHTTTTQAGLYGNDVIAGGSDNDTIFGQLGDDAIQGDGAAITLSGDMIYDIAVNRLSADDYDGVGRDGDDYVEGGGGNDVIFGNLGQDDLIGGSSNLFGTPTASDRPDGSDIIYGGSGTRADRNNPGDTTPNGHARDADVILGDNGNIFRIVGTNGTPGGSGYLTFTYDTYGTQKIVPRTIQYLDYVFGGANNTSLNDELHGEAGDDIIHGMAGHDVMFGDAQDDDLIGGAGNDRIFGGDGEDGILGDDGRIFTSRNGFTETLHGITTVTASAEVHLAGTVIGAIVNVDDRLKKSVDLASYTVGGHDIIYGGLGDDFIHGGAGDDALSGAEATDAWYITTAQGDASILNYNATTRMFADYNPVDPLSKIAGFVLNFDATDSFGAKVDDGMDNIFGNDGNDWLVGGTRNDRMFGGMGDDLLNADDNLDTNGGLNNVVDATAFADADFAFGGGGFDVLIANTGADRLIDWSKRFNTFVVPVLPTVTAPMVAAPTVLRDPTPPLVNLLLELGRSGGADQSISVEADALYAELGLVTIEDGPIWNAQIWQGLDRDPRPANLFAGIDTLGALEARPAAPKRVTPTSSTLALTPTFTWTAVPGATGYEIRIDRLYASPGTVLRDASATGTSYTVSTPLVRYATYRVWIRAINARGELGAWSQSLTFTVVSSDEAGSSDDQNLNGEFADGSITDDALATVIESFLKSSAKATVVSVSHSAEVSQVSDENESSQIHRLDGPAESVLSVHNPMLTGSPEDDSLDAMIQSIANELLMNEE